MFQKKKIIKLAPCTLMLIARTQVISENGAGEEGGGGGQVGGDCNHHS